MVIEVTFDTTDVYISTTVSPVYVNVSFEAPSGGGGAEWGDITGTLSDQTDLQTALDGKFDDPTGTTAQYLRGDGSLATFPSLTGFVPYTGATGDVNLGTHRITAQNATISSNGSGDTVTLNHSSGSGIGLNITKGGNGEGLYINKTGGSGNAATIIGTLNATTLVKSGGTSSQFLKADGTVDSSVYVPTSTTLTINGVSYDLSANRSWTVSGGISGSGASGQVSYWDGTTSQAGSNNLFWDNTNGRLGIGTITPSSAISILKPVGQQATMTFRTLDNTSSNGYSGFSCFDESNNLAFSFAYGNTGSAYSNTAIIGARTSTGRTQFVYGASATVAATLFSNGNFGFGSTTDSGQRLQVQGTTLLNGNVTFPSATGMFWDAANGRLGIGTTSPANPLHVTGNVRFDAAIRDNRDNSILTQSASNVITNRVLTIGNGTYSNITFSQVAGGYFVIPFIATVGTRLFVGGGSDTGEAFQVTGTMKVTGASSFGENITMTKNSNAGFGVNIVNTTSGVNSNLFMTLQSDTNSGSTTFGKYSTASTAYKIIAVKDAYLYNNTTAGDFSILNDFTSGAIKFAAGGASTPHMTIKSNGRINMSSLPTSSTGLATGDLWNDAGTIKIV